MKKITDQQARACSRYLRVSPFKVRRILDQIRGRSYFDSLLILKFMPYKACLPILKVLLSAVNNAKQLYNLDESKLIVTEARADAGPILKRFRPHAQGRGFPIKKPMCHIIIKVSSI